MARAESLAAFGQQALFTSLSGKMQQLSFMKWGKCKQQHFLLASAALWYLLTAQSSPHLSGGTCWDVFVSPLDEAAQKYFFSLASRFCGEKEMSGLASEQRQVCKHRAVALVIEGLQWPFNSTWIKDCTASLGSMF